MDVVANLSRFFILATLIISVYFPTLLFVIIAIRSLKTPEIATKTTTLVKRIVAVIIIIGWVVGVIQTGLFFLFSYLIVIIFAIYLLIPRKTKLLRDTVLFIVLAILQQITILAYVESVMGPL